MNSLEKLKIVLSSFSELCVEEHLDSNFKKLDSLLVQVFADKSAPNWGEAEDKYPVKERLNVLRELKELSKAVPLFSIEDEFTRRTSLEVTTRLEKGELENEILLLELFIWSVLDQTLSTSYSEINSIINSKRRKKQRDVDSVHNITEWTYQMAFLEKDWLFFSDRPNPERTFWKEAFGKLESSIAGETANLERFLEKEWPSPGIHEAFGKRGKGAPYRHLSINLLYEGLMLTGQVNNPNQYIAKLYEIFGVNISPYSMKSRMVDDYFDLPSPIDLWKDLERLRSLLLLSPHKQ